jgi:hypothetical protein
MLNKVELKPCKHITDTCCRSPWSLVSVALIAIALSLTVSQASGEDAAFFFKDGAPPPDVSAPKRGDGGILGEVPKEGAPNEDRDAKVGAAGEQFAEDTPLPTEDGALKLKLRIISGGEGVAFPKPEEVVLEPVPTFAQIEAVTHYTPEPTATPWMRPGKCAASGNRRIEMLNIQDNDDRVLNDRLFVASELNPLDPDEIYGVGVKIYQYGSGVGEEQYTYQEIYQVPCLPFRIRSTSWGEIQYFGNDALKRYDPSSKERPDFHPWVAERLFGVKGNGGSNR